MRYLDCEVPRYTSSINNWFHHSAWFFSTFLGKYTVIASLLLNGAVFPDESQIFLTPKDLNLGVLDLPHLPTLVAAAFFFFTFRVSCGGLEKTSCTNSCQDYGWIGRKYHGQFSFIFVSCVQILISDLSSRIYFHNNMFQFLWLYWLWLCCWCFFMKAKTIIYSQYWIYILNRSLISHKRIIIFV